MTGKGIYKYTLEKNAAAPFLWTSLHFSEYRCQKDSPDCREKEEQATVSRLEEEQVSRVKEKKWLSRASWGKGVLEIDSLSM